MCNIIRQLVTANSANEIQIRQLSDMPVTNECPILVYGMPRRAIWSPQRLYTRVVIYKEISVSHGNPNFQIS